MPLDWTHETPTLLSGPSLAPGQPELPARVLLVSDVPLQSALDNAARLRHSTDRPLQRQHVAI